MPHFYVPPTTPQKKAESKRLDLYHFSSSGETGTITYVLKWTGHSNYEAMKPYIDIADDIKATAMTKFNQL